jgi:hypothetical protein
MDALTPMPLSPYTSTASLDGAGVFDEVIDVINPLQHIPFVSQLYQAIANDPISVGAKVIGGGLFGGAIGAASSAVTAMVEGINGESLITTASSFVKDVATSQETASPEYLPTTSTPLQADNGEAILSMIAAGTFTEAQTLAPPPFASSTPDLPLRNFREARPMGMQGDALETQMSSSIVGSLKNL